MIVAIVLAWPVAFAAMSAWLDGFAYRVGLDWTTFLLASALAMAIALLTVSFQAVRAVAANPVEALRMEWKRTKSYHQRKKLNNAGRPGTSPISNFCPRCSVFYQKKVEKRYLPVRT